MPSLKQKIELDDVLDLIENSFTEEERKDSSSGWDSEINSPEDLKRVIAECFQVEGKPLIIPDQSICEGHNSPFQFLWEAYTDKVKDAIVIGPRNGGKTLISATLEFLWFGLRAVVETCHCAAILLQSQRAYGYIYSWAIRNKEALEISKITRSETVRNKGGKIEVITGTAASVNGPHPHKAIIDEFELMDWDVFQEATSMPKSSDEVEAALILLTTRKYPSGNAQKMIDESAQTGIRVWKWCIFEVMGRCDCTGKDPCACDPDKDKYKKFDREGKEITWSSVCKGKGKRCGGYYKFSDVIRKFLTLDWEKFKAQWLCDRPEKSDVVYAEFHEDLNVIDPLSTEEVNSLYKDGWLIGRGWDFGYDDPTVCLFYLFKHGEEMIQFQEISLSGELIDDFGNKVLALSNKVEPNQEKWEDWGDIAGHARTGVDTESYITKLYEKDIFVQSQVQRILTGINTQKKLIKKSSYTGFPRKYVCSNCTKTLDAFYNAQWERTEGKQNKFSKEKYRHDQHSHTLDADRYFTVGICYDEIQEEEKGD